MATRNFSNRDSRPVHRADRLLKRRSSGFGGGQKEYRRIYKSGVIHKQSGHHRRMEHFVPEHNFQDFNVDQTIKKSIASKGYITPTPIQDRVIAHILNGSDVVGVVNTGTGKTAAFLIPLINKVILNRREKVLIVVPTRELALQIENELQGFTRGMRIFPSVASEGPVWAARYHN